MNIIVCIKQVPDVSEVSWDPETGSLIRKGIPSIINPNDKNAIEAALQIKEKHGGKVTLISMGPNQVEDALRKGLSMGADDAIQLTSKDFAGSDTWATSYTLGLAIKKIDEFDLIICGKEALDGMTAQVGPQLAESLNIPQLTYAVNIDIDGSKIIVVQKLENYHRKIETKLPALVTVERDINQPRVPPMDAILEAYSKEILKWSVDDLNGDKENFGLKASPTKLRKVYSPKRLKNEIQIIGGDLKDIANKFVNVLKENQFL